MGLLSLQSTHEKTGLELMPKLGIWENVSIPHNAALVGSSLDFGVKCCLKFFLLYDNFWEFGIE